MNLRSLNMCFVVGVAAVFTASCFVQATATQATPDESRPTEAEIDAIFADIDAYRNAHGDSRIVNQFATSSIHKGSRVSSDRQALSLALRASAQHGFAGENQSALDDANAALAIPNVSPLARSQVLLVRANILRLRKRSEAIADYTSAIDTPGLPEKKRIAALIDRVDARFRSGDVVGAQKAYNDLAKDPSLPTDVRSRALRQRADGWASLKRHDQAIEDLTRAADLPGIPTWARVAALRDRGNIKSDLKQFDAACADYDLAIEAAKASPEKIGAASDAETMKKRARNLQARELELKASGTAIEKAKNPAERADALVARARLFVKFMRPTDAVADFLEASKTPGASADQMASACFEAWNLEPADRKSQNVIQSLDSVIESPSMPAALVNRASFLRADLYLKNNNAARAIAIFTSVIDRGAEHEGFVEALRQRGTWQARLGKFDLALADVDRLMAESRLTTAERAVAQVTRGAIQTSRGDKAAAMKDLSEALASVDLPRASRGEALVRRGLLHVEKSAIETGFLDLKDAVEITETPANFLSTARTIRGHMFLRAKRPDLAVPELSQVISMRDAPADDVASARRLRADAHRQLGKSKEADDDYASVIATRSTPPAALAEAYYWRGRLEGGTYTSKLRYDEVLKIPDAPASIVSAALAYRALCLVDNGDKQAALADVERVLKQEKIDPEHRAVATAARAVCESRSGQQDAALKSYSAAIDSGALPPRERVDALLNRASLHRSMKNPAAESSDFATALETNGASDNDRARILDARAFVESLKFKDRAALQRRIDDYTRIIALKDIRPSTRWQALRKRSECYANLGDRARAIADLQTVIAANDDFESASARKALAELTK